MQGSSRFAVAIHALALTLISRQTYDGRPVTSNQIAAMVGAHPVHVRRVLGTLRSAGLVVSRSGPRGGWELSRPPEEITLFDVFSAVEPESPFELPLRPPEACCRFAPNLPATLERCLGEAKLAVEIRLSQITIADLMAGSATGCPGISNGVLAGQEDSPRI